MSRNIYNISGFDSVSNMAINKAIDIARKYGLKYVDSRALMCALLSRNSMSIRFEELTGIKPSKYLAKLSDNLYKESNLNNSLVKNIDTSFDENTEEEIGIANLTDELSKLLNTCIKNNDGNDVEVIDILEEILLTPTLKVWETLEGLGVNPNRVVIMINDPAEYMPIASKYSVNLVKKALNNEMDPVCCRDDIIDSVIETLGRRIKNNPCLIGDAGVGKTAIINGIAQRIVCGDVPFYLKGKHILSIDVSSMVAGTRYRGDFEERINGLLTETANNKDVILFFDEIHMLAEAGASSESSINALNILKPAISNGNVQIIGATTTAEYKKFIEKDSAFERRLESIIVPEVSVDDAITILSNVIYKFDTFHNSKTSKEVIEAAVKLSDRYISYKKLPDKAITVIDATASRLKKKANGNLVEISESDIKETISKLSGIDVTEMTLDSKNSIKTLYKRLEKHVIGQSNAVDNISKAIRRSKAGIKDPNKPIGSFLFVGPTGVGKTELSKALAIEFSGSLKNLIRFDMSEFMEKHSVSKLIGSPPGYVGYGEGGQLTEAIRHNPYSVILFDEIEKAHPDVFNILLQVLDDGILTDGSGLRIDCKNTVIIMTSNAGYGESIGTKASIGFASSKQEEKDTSKIESRAIKSLENTFRPEFLNRLDKIVVFNKLDKENCIQIIELMLNQLKERLQDNKIEISWDDKLINMLLSEGFSEKYGARNLKRKIQDTVENVLADKIIDEEIKATDKVLISYDRGLTVNISQTVGLNKEYATC